MAPRGKTWLDTLIVGILIADLPELLGRGPLGTVCSCALPSWMVDLGARVRQIAEGATARGVLAAGRHALHWAAGRTGLPVIVVAALALVVGWRVARRTWHIAFELALAVAVLLVATRLGWIRW